MTKTQPVSRWLLARVLFRSLFLQATTNFERMQNVGFGYCMAPVLKRLYTGEELQAAMRRHLEFYNSHPYMSAAVLGAAVRMETQIAAGELPAGRVSNFKRSMMGPMAAIGDSFFWSSLRPLSAALAVVSVLSGILWAPLALLLLYNFCHITVRIWGISAGYRLGEQVVMEIYRVNLPRFADLTHYVTAVFLGATGGLFVAQAQRSKVALGDGLEPILFVVLCLIFLLSLRRKISMPRLLYGFATGCLILVGVLNALFPLL